MGITRAKHVVLFLHGTFYRYGLHHGPACHGLLPDPVLCPCEKLLPDPVLCPCEKLLPDPVLREPARSHDSGQPVFQQPVPQTQYTTIQRTVPKVEVKEVKEKMMREKPKMCYDARTVMVPKLITEDYEEWTTKMVAIQIPVPLQRQKWITEPRVISIPRPMIEKRTLTKTVTKTIEVEEEYEVEAPVTEQEEYEATRQEFITTQVTEDVQVPVSTAMYSAPVSYAQPAYTSYGSITTANSNYNSSGALYKTVDPPAA